MAQVRSQAFLRKRKMLMVLPLLAIPFLTMAFWAMGGGKTSAATSKTSDEQGLNLQLPNSNLNEDKTLDKLSFYNQADKDSIKLAELMRNDPYYKGNDTLRKNDLEKITENSAMKFNQPTPGLKTSPYNGSTDPAEKKVMQKIAELNKVINQPQQNSTPVKNQESNPDLDKLQNMMQVMKGDGDENNVMKQINGTLEKILDIQHPERLNEKIKTASEKNKGQVFAVSGRNTAAKNNSSFYELNGDNTSREQDNSISAVINDTKTIEGGSTIKLRLLTDIYVGGMLIPKNNFVFGTASLENERLFINIETIRYRNNLFPVRLSVYDLDGLRGISIPGSTTRDVAKESTDQTMQNLQLMSLDPSLKIQAANAGIQMAKSLLTKKIKLVKITLKAGYQVLLRDENKNEN